MSVVGRQLRARGRSAAIDAISGTKPNRTSRLAVVAAVQLGDRARRDDQHQEGEDPGLDRERPERDLLVAEHAGDADHAAVEDGEGEQARGMVAGAAVRRWAVSVMAARRNGFALGPQAVSV